VVSRSATRNAKARLLRRVMGMQKNRQKLKVNYILPKFLK